MKKYLKIISTLSAFFYIFFFLLDKKVLAADNQNLPAPNQNILGIIGQIMGGGIEGKTNYHDLLDLISQLVTEVTSFILFIIPIFALLMIMYAGIQYIFAGDNPKKTEDAVKLLNSSIIGFAAFLMLYALWGFINNFIK